MHLSKQIGELTFTIKITYFQPKALINTKYFIYETFSGTLTLQQLKQKQNTSIQEWVQT